MATFEYDCAFEDKAGKFIRFRGGGFATAADAKENAREVARILGYRKPPWWAFWRWKGSELLWRD